MYAVIKIHLTNGEVAAYGPFTEKRNANKAAEWHRNPMWHAEVVPLTKVIEGSHTLAQELR